MSQKTHEDLQHYLDSAGLRYRRLEHEQAASAEQYHREVGSRLEQQAKCLFVRAKEDGQSRFAVYALPACKRGDLSAVAAALGVRKARLANPGEMMKVTSCCFGELPPTGRLFGVPLIFDRDLLQEDEIYFNAGHLRISFVVDPHELVALEAPILVGGDE